MNRCLFVLAHHIASRLRPVTHINVILSLLESILSSLLVLEDLGEYALRLKRRVLHFARSALQRHAAAVDCVELAFDVNLPR